ncbi:hypothetical protein QR680_017164 [Steinernema hermaphroditum]|uniref:Uncharacterized protein n=1 Tax=Steinernema hermaphroditum TaxID=289476 RepID=A0AA39LNM4_9BILA|nr:hypothetical protein QR680_017164 [Steinernema hermaphroditum]
MDEESMEVEDVGDPLVSVIDLREALRDGTFLDKLDRFEDNELRLFVPYLASEAFSSGSCASTSNPQLVTLRRRLHRFPSGNFFLQLTEGIDIQKLVEESQVLATSETAAPKFFKTSFETADSATKLKLIATYVLFKTNQNESNKNLANFESFNPFDVAVHQDEVTTILSILFGKCCHLIKPVKVVRLLMHHEEGLRLFEAIILNSPSLDLPEVLTALLGAEAISEAEKILNQKKIFIKKLLSLDRRLPYEILQRLRDRVEAHFILFMDILTEMIPVQDFVIQALSTLLQEDRKLVQFMRKSAQQKRSLKFMSRLDNVVHEATASRLSKVDSERLMVLIAFVLCSNFNKLISSDKLDNWIKFLTHFNASFSLRHLRIALAAICACNSTSGAQFECSVTTFFQQLKRLVFSDSTQYASLNQLMLLLAIHFNKRNEEQINLLLSSELGFSVSVNVRGTTIRTLYLRHAMTERDVVESATKISVTRGLTEHTSGYLPAHCINHLLLGKTFSKHQVGIQSWIQRQLLECRDPIHPIMGELLSSYASSCVPSVESASCNVPLSDDFLKDVFSGDIFDPLKRATRVLCLHFVFAYTKQHHKFMMKTTVRELKRPGAPPDPNALAYAQLDDLVWHRQSYTETILPIIPIRYLLSVVEAAPENYRPIRAKLINTVSHFMPYMLPDIDALLAGDSAFLDGGFDSLASRVSSAKLIAAFDQIERTGDNTAICQLLSHLEHAPVRTLSRLQPAICHGMKSTLDERTSEWVVEVVTNLWKQLEMIQTRKLYDETIKKWIVLKNVNSQAVIEQPLLLFRCDKRVLHSAHHLQCLLRMLNFFLSACHANFHIKKEKARKDEEDDDPVRLMHALTGAQYSAIVQVLISICNNASERVQKVVGSQIHRMFIAEPQVSRLVHYQTYPLHLVPVVVKNVPSMHIMIEHVPELFISPKIQRRIFGIVLMVELAHQYKIPASLVKIELILDVIHTLLAYVSTDYNVALFLSIVPSLSRLMRLFPQVASAVTSLLMRMSMVAQARGAVIATVVHRRDTPERRLIGMIEREIENNVKRAVGAR